jgi:hypothetical protein
MGRDFGLVLLGTASTPLVFISLLSRISSACHRLVLELSRAYQEGKAATIGHPSRVGERG